MSDQGEFQTTSEIVCEKISYLFFEFQIMILLQLVAAENRHHSYVVYYILFAWIKRNHITSC